MTAPCSSRIVCPHCGRRITAESGFGRWLRKMGAEGGPLCSEDGFVFSDLDFIAHRFKMRGKKEVQYLMAIEVKEDGRDVTPSQEDTLGVFGRIVRTKVERARRRGETGQFEKWAPVLRVFSPMAEKKVDVICYGVHTLQMDGSCPETSSTILWDRKRISVEELVDLLRFDINPDSLRRMEHRQHKKLRVVQRPLLDSDPSDN